MTTLRVSPTVHIGNVIRNAAVFDLKHWRGDAVDPDSLIQTVERLFALLRERQIEYVLVGGVALLQYIEGRNTEDIDLIMALPSLQRLPEIAILEQDQDFARGNFDDLQIDIRLARNPLFDKVQRRFATMQRFAEQAIPCATVEGLILLKLYALPSLYRQGNFARVGIYENDIATLLHDYRPPLEPLFAELAAHLNDADLAEVREVTADLERRIVRFGSARGE
jgi:hypothetical protein